MDSVVILVLLIIVVAVVILLMKNIENSKKMDALRNDAIERSNKKEAEYNARKIQTVGDQSLALEKSKQKEAESNARIITKMQLEKQQRRREFSASVRRMDGTYRGEPRRQVPADGNRTQTVWGSRPTPAIDVPPLEMIPVPDDIETVGDQSLTLDEDQSQEYDEMAAVSGIREVAPPQTDENWVASRQVEPVKDLSVGIAITNDVSKKENLQTGKTSSKFPFPHKGPMRPPRIPNAAQRVAMQQAAQRAAQQQRDSEIRDVIDKRIRSMAGSAEMEKRARNDNSGIKQYDIPKGRKGPSLGLMKPAVMPIGYNAAREAMKDAKKAMERANAKPAVMPNGRSPSFGLMKPAVMPYDYDKIRAAEKGTKKAAAEAPEEADMKDVKEADMKDVKEAMKRANAKPAVMPKGRKGPSLGLMKPAVMPIGYNEIRAAEKAAMMSAVEGYEIMKPWGSMVY